METWKEFECVTKSTCAHISLHTCMKLPSTKKANERRNECYYCILKVIVPYW